MTDDSLTKALTDARIPRYTSYPPANRFTAQIGADRVEAWLRGVTPGTAVSLYVHVPYCRRLCWFCACRTQGTRSDEPLDRYLDHLDREIGLVADRLPDVTISALHLGGGTPTILSAERLDRLSAMIRKAFAMKPGTEISVEIDPTECDAPRLDALARMGVRRVSIGVQDFDPIVQDVIGRHQGFDVTAEVAGATRARGIDSLNVDLVYGLPHQTSRRLNATLDRVLSLRPDRLAIFGYAHVPWMSRRQALVPDTALPGPAERLALARLARDRLIAAGYRAIGIDHFALPTDRLSKAADRGTLRRNFQGYTTDAAPVLIGLGPSSISRFPEGYAQNQTSTGGWQTAVAAGRLPIARGAELRRIDRVVAAVIEALMCSGEADLHAIARAHAFPKAALSERAGRLITALPGIGHLVDDRLEIADRSAWRLAASRFDSALESGANAYSLAT